MKKMSEDKITFSITETTVYRKMVHLDVKDGWEHDDYVQEMEELIRIEPHLRRIDLKDGWVAFEDATLMEEVKGEWDEHQKCWIVEEVDIADFPEGLAFIGADDD